MYGGVAEQTELSRIGFTIQDSRSLITEITERGGHGEFGRRKIEEKKIKKKS